jgi:phage terminase small subunit
MTNPHQKKAKQKQEEKKDALDRPLRDREEQFCRQIVLGKTQADAYINAQYKAKNKASANTLAQRLLRKVYIQSRIAALRVESAERYKLTPNNIMFQTGAILNADMRNYVMWGPGGVTIKPSTELTDEQAAAIEEVSETVTKDGGTVRVKLHNKAKSQELGAKILGMVSDKQEMPGEITLKVVYDSGKPKKA